MIAAISLLAYAGLLLTAGAAMLARARWAERAPRLAIAAWLALNGSAAGSVALGGVALVVPTARVSCHLAHLLATCVLTVRARYAHPGGAALTVAGALLALAVAGRVMWCTARALAHARRAGLRHCRRLRVVGRADPRLGAVIVDYGEPAAYCLPGARRPIVLTTAVIEALDEAQLAAVLAHERAHQQGRHHLLVLIAGALAAAFPHVAAFRHGQEQITRLVELHADDVAARALPRLTVAEALLALSAPVASGPVPGTRVPGTRGVAAPLVLGAGGSATETRIRRLLGAPAPLGRARAIAVMAALAVLTAFPFLVLTGPALTLIGAHYCPPTEAVILG
ncbi:MAG TPA: M56 family metallopeptidase [Streptosporangiaceae bacterium]|nr:M56 family metallopeptidase [Streptosporangiaceae bacterium]